MNRQGGLNFLRQPSRFLTLIRCRKANIDDFGVKCVTGGFQLLSLIRKMVEIGCEPAQIGTNDLLKTIFPKWEPIFRKWEPPYDDVKPSSERFIMESFFRALVTFRFPICEDDCVIIPHGLFYGVVHAAIRRVLYGDSADESERDLDNE